MSSLAELDRSNVVDVDLGGAEFKANAHRQAVQVGAASAGCVLGSGPPRWWSAATPTSSPIIRHQTWPRKCRAGAGWEQFDEIMERAVVTQMDGEQGMPAFSPSG